MRGLNLLAVHVVVGSASSVAFGQGYLTGSNQKAEADAYYRTGSTIIGNYGLTTDIPGFDFLGIEDRFNVVNDFWGRGYALLGSTFSPSSPGIGNAFSSVILDACTSAEIISAGTTNSEDRVFGVAHGEIQFDVLSAQAWSWNGGWQGSTYNSGAFYQVSGEISLVDSFGGVFVQETRSSLNGIGDWAESFAFGGVLNPGSYTLTWSHESIVANGATPWGFYGTTTGGGPLISCINSTFSLVPAPGSMAIVGFGVLMASARRR